MADPQASRFWRAALQSGLLDAQALTACYEGIPPVKRDDPDNLDRRLARQAVLSQALTLWQAQQLMAGRTSGYKVDRYVLLDMIGQGGMGRVYLARDSRLNRRVALKILSPERINNPRAIARFQREARVGAQLQHENLVRIYDFGESNGRFFLVMEFIEGRTIGSLIGEGGPIPPAVAVRLVRQVALGLEHAHRKGLIHRDVNPYNIMVTHDGTAKLADLGLAIDLADEDHVTREGATVGTFDYVAPEQARHSHSADIRSDIYSLGCSLYHMLSGHVPFPSPSLPEKLFAHQATDPKPLEEIVPNIPPGLARVVARMMRKNPDERFATPLDVAQALEAFADSGALAAEDEGRPSKSPDAPLDQGRAQAQPDVPLPPQADHPEPIAPPAVAPKTPAESLGEPHVETSPIESFADRLKHVEPPRALSLNPASTSDPEFQFGVDLGPEPSLSEGFQRPRLRLATALGGKPSSSSDAKNEEDRISLPSLAFPTWFRNYWFWGLAAGLFVILAILIGFATGLFSLKGDSTKKPRGTTANQTKASATAKPVPTLVVKSGEDEDDVTPANLDEALRTTLSHRGWWIEVGDDKPLRITRDQSFNLLTAVTPLILRAAPGHEPVIEVEGGRTKPVFSTGSSVLLELDGLTIKVQGDGAQDASKSPFIQAGGRLKLRRTRMSVEGSPAKGSRAIVSDGGALDVEGCFFQGFDRALEIRTLGLATTRIAQTMFVPSPLPPSEWYGWALQIPTPSGATPNLKTPPHVLTLDHCTFDGVGFLDLVAGTTSLIVECDVKHCAIRAEALIAFSSTSKPVQPAFDRVRWVGVGNQIQIRGKSWVVLGADQGTPTLSAKSVVDLDDWIKTGAKEEQPIRAEIRFQTPLKERGKSPLPSDFAVATPPPPATTPGADPARVGPGGSR